MRIITIPILSLLLVLTACARQTKKPELATWATFHAWSQDHFATNAPTFDTTTLYDGTVYLDVYGLTDTSLQDSLIRALASTSPVPTKVTFWTSETSWSFHTVIAHASKTDQAPLLSDEDLARERQAKFVREVKMKR